MDLTSRNPWPIRLTFLGTIALCVYAPSVVAMLLAMVAVPISFHYLIRWSRSKAKSAGQSDTKRPIQDLALIFASAPAIWLALILDPGYGQEPQLNMVALWLWFQFAFLAPVLLVGRRQVLPGPNDSLKIGFFFIPWMLVALFMAVGGRREAWRATYLDPRTRLACYLIALAAVLSLYLAFRLRSSLKDFSKTLFARPAPRPDSRCRFFILGFVFLPLIWGLLFASLCLHWQIYVGDSTPEASLLATRGIALHQAFVELTGLALAFGFPLATFLVWYGLNYRMGASPEPWSWLGVFLPWAFLLLVIGVDPGGWFAWFF